MDQQQARRLSERLHIVEAMASAAERPVEFVKLVAASSHRSQARQALMSEWGLSHVQASHILDMPFGRVTTISKHELAEEAASLRTELATFDER